MATPPTREKSTAGNEGLISLIGRRLSHGCFPSCSLQPSQARKGGHPSAAMAWCAARLPGTTVCTRGNGEGQSGPPWITGLSSVLSYSHFNTEA